MSTFTLFRLLIESVARLALADTGQRPVEDSHTETGRVVNSAAELFDILAASLQGVLAFFDAVSCESGRTGALEATEKILAFSLRMTGTGRTFVDVCNLYSESK